MLVSCFLFFDTLISKCSVIDKNEIPCKMIPMAKFMKVVGGQWLGLVCGHVPRSQNDADAYQKTHE